MSGSSATVLWSWIGRFGSGVDLLALGQATWAAGRPVVGSSVGSQSPRTSSAWGAPLKSARGERRSGVAPLTFDELERRPALPLRLGLSRGGLGVELNHPLQVGPVSVEQFEWSLPGLDYPLDLSGGVKQFLDRRGLFERAVVRLRPSELGRALSERAPTLLGEPATCRIRAFADEAIVAVTLWSDSVALVFELVLVSAVDLRWVIHGARGFGLDRPPLELASFFLREVTEPLAAAASPHFDGRSLSCARLLDSLSLEFMPGLGCRVPEVEGVQLTALESDRGDLVLSLERHGEPSNVSGLAVRLAGLADALLPGDRALLAGERERARALYLEALEDSPTTPEILFELAQLDAMVGDRTESARLLLERARERLALRGETDDLARGDDALYSALEAQLFERAGVRERAQELWRRAAEGEGDPVLSALYLERAAELTHDSEEQLELLHHALERAPQLKSPRWKRIGAILQKDDPPPRALEFARADVEQLHAGAQGSEAKATVLERAAELFGARGHGQIAIAWLRQALVLDPERTSTKVALGQRLLDAGQEARAVDLLRSVLRKLEPSRSAEGQIAFSNFSELDRVRVLLARGLSLGFEEHAEVVRLTAMVDSRSEYSLAARELEWKSALRLERSVQRRVLSRLVEALELGYLPGSPEEKERTLELARGMLDHENGDPLSEFRERLQRYVHELEARASR